MLQDTTDRPIAAASVFRELQILERRQVLEHPTPLRDVSYAQTSDAIGGPAYDLTAFEEDRAGARPRQSEDAAHRRRPGAVETQKRNELTLPDRQRVVAQDVALPVKRIEPRDPQQLLRHARGPLSRDTLL